MCGIDVAKNHICPRWKDSITISWLLKWFLWRKNVENEKWTKQINEQVQAVRNKSIGIDKNC